jgi:hypothetical protein
MLTALQFHHFKIVVQVEVDHRPPPGNRVDRRREMMLFVFLLGRTGVTMCAATAASRFPAMYSSVLGQLWIHPELSQPHHKPSSVNP